MVRGPDLLWGGDVRSFNPPAGRFDGVIGGDPCQSHSALANLVRAKGQTPRYPDMTAEYRRVLELAQPAWFLRENVPQAPALSPDGYGVTSFLLDNSWLDAGDGCGESQMRKRRFWFGTRGRPAPNLLDLIQLAPLMLPDIKAATSCDGRRGHREGRTQAVTADSRAVPVAIGGSGKRKSTRTATVTGRHQGHVGTPTKDYSTRYTLEEMLELQGLPAEFFGFSPFTVQGKRQAIGNGVPLPMGHAIAKAVKAALQGGGL